MSGMGNGSFAPGEYTTRAQVAQILYNLHGNPEVSGGTPFTDLPGDKVGYITIAYTIGMTNGTSALQAASTATSTIPILGTSAESIDMAEDRERFDELLERFSIKRAQGRGVLGLEEALAAERA